MRSRALTRPIAAGTALIACLATAGCSPESGSGPAAASPTVESASPSEILEEPTEATETPTADESVTETPTPYESVTAVPTTPRGRLLSAAELPGFNEQFRWTAGATRNREPRTPFGTCQRFDMTSIGATRMVVRDFRPVATDSRASAGELVADFADDATARRAFGVLKSWRGRCDDQLKRYQRSRVGDLEDVKVGGGTGAWYLLVYGPPKNDPDSGWFDAQGMARVGSRIAMVEMVVLGQDYNYESGKEPMVAAVQRAAAKIG